MKFCLACEALFESETWQCPHCNRFPKIISGQLAFAPELAINNNGYDPDRYNEMPNVENENFWRKARNRLFTWAMHHYFPKASDFLEIGSGIGVVLKAFEKDLPGLTLWGMETYVLALNLIKQKLPRINMFQADARHIPFREEFDVIGAFDVLEHIDEDEKVLEEMYKATKSCGGILLSVPQHPCLWSQRDEYLCHKRRYTKLELIEKVKLAGFEPLRVTSFVTFPLPLMIVSALKNRKPKADFDPFAEFKIGSLANEILNKTLSLERQAIKSGISFPFGGSLLVVAIRK